MNGSMMAYLTIATMFFLGCLVILTKMLLDYRSRESQSRASQIQAQMEMMAAMVRQSGEVVKIQTELTELILVGRPAEPTSLQQPSESPTVTLPNSNELFRDLPDNIREAMLREVEEEATWQSPSQTQPEVSDIEEMEEILRSTYPTASESTWVPQPEESNSG